MFDTFRRFRRSSRVVRTGLGVYIGYKRTQRAVRKLTPEEAETRWLARHEKSAEALYRLAVDLKGLYIKTGQFIGTRTDIVPPAYAQSLSRLQDQVPPRPFSVVRTTVEHELGRPLSELFLTVDETPLGAASLAQVHRATLHDGRQVVIKVQYPEVAGLVKLDVRNLKTLVAIVARREPNFDYRSVVAEFASQVPLELDFVREAAMMRAIAANLRDLPGVVVPEVIEGYVSRKVLVTAYIDGARLLDAPRLAAMSTDRPALAMRIAGAYGHQILVDGLFQADPHPGNILVLPDGEVGLIDYGLTKDLPDAARLGFARLVVAAANHDAAGAAAAFAELGAKTRGDNPQGPLMLMRFFLDARGGPTPQRRAALAANPVDAIPSDLILLGRVVGLLRGVCATLGSPLTPMEMLLPFAERALKPVVTPSS